jgi:ankyrin repeat protein
MVKLLLEAGADASRAGHAGENAILLLMKEEVHEAVPELLAAGADPEAYSGIDQAFPLLLAVRRGDAGLVKLLLEAGEDPNRHTWSDRNLGVMAAQQGDRETFRLLQDGGLSLAYGKSTLLHRAATDGDLERLALLLDAGTDPDLLDEKGRSPLLILATRHAGREPEGEAEGAEAAVRLLIRHGADVNLRSDFDTTALVLAASREYRVGVCRILVESGADVNAANGTGRRTALMEAARAAQAEIVELLLEAGADPNAASVGLNRSTPLVDGLRSGDTRTVDLLIGAGARVNAPDRSWGDAFHRAAPHPELVRALVRLGEDLNAEDELHRRAVEQVIRHGVPESLEMMLAAGATVRCGRVPSLLDPDRSGPEDPLVRAGMASLLAGPCPGLVIE